MHGISLLGIKCLYKIFNLFKCSWYGQLYEKFRNERKRSCDPEALLQKSKRIKTEGDKSNVGKPFRRSSGIDWEPLFPEGEDEASIKLHKTALKTEFKKRLADMGKVNSRMALTYPDRRRMINNKTPIVEMKEVYPSLFCHDQVIYIQYVNVAKVKLVELTVGFTKDNVK